MFFLNNTYYIWQCNGESPFAVKPLELYLYLRVQYYILESIRTETVQQLVAKLKTLQLW